MIAATDTPPRCVMGCGWMILLIDSYPATQAENRITSTISTPATSSVLP